MKNVCTYVNVNQVKPYEIKNIYRGAQRIKNFTATVY